MSDVRRHRNRPATDGAEPGGHSDIHRQDDNEDEDQCDADKTYGLGLMWTTPTTSCGTSAEPPAFRSGIRRSGKEDQPLVATREAGSIMLWSGNGALMGRDVRRIVGRRIIADHASSLVVCTRVANSLHLTDKTRLTEI